MRRLSLALSLLLLATPAAAGPCELARIAYAPQDDLESIDIELIGSATKSLDMSAYVLTNVAVVEAVTAAAQRGVAVRLYRDGRVTREPRLLREAIERLMQQRAVEVRFKGSPAPFMHLKNYLVDGALLREGAANFTRSGLKRQDNSLIALRCPEAARIFQDHFNAMWGR
jgi:phosphatidylserine/phosphatidylglycerophosphate/cardiolipin synthase-like enzyme